MTKEAKKKNLVVLLEAVERLACHSKGDSEAGMALASYSIRSLASLAIELEQESCNEEATA